MCLIYLVDLADDIRLDRITVAEARIERQAVRAVFVHEILAQLRRHRPLAEERDLVEPAPPAGARMSHDRGTALPRAECAAVFPLELNLVRTTVALDRVAVLRDEGISARGPGVVLV